MLDTNFLAEHEIKKICTKEIMDENNTNIKINIFSSKKKNFSLYQFIIFDEKGRYYDSTCITKKDLDKNIANIDIKYLDSNRIRLNSVILEIDNEYGIAYIDNKIEELETKLDELKKYKKNYKMAFFNFN